MDELDITDAEIRDCLERIDTIAEKMSKLKEIFTLGDGVTEGDVDQWHEEITECIALIDELELIAESMF